MLYFHSNQKLTFYISAEGASQPPTLAEGLLNPVRIERRDTGLPPELRELLLKKTKDNPELKKQALKSISESNYQALLNGTMSPQDIIKLLEENPEIGSFQVSFMFRHNDEFVIILTDSLGNVKVIKLETNYFDSLVNSKVDPEYPKFLESIPESLDSKQKLLLLDLYSKGIPSEIIMQIIRTEGFVKITDYNFGGQILTVTFETNNKTTPNNLSTNELTAAQIAKLSPFITTGSFDNTVVQELFATDLTDAQINEFAIAIVDLGTKVTQIIGVIEENGKTVVLYENSNGENSSMTLETQTSEKMQALTFPGSQLVEKVGVLRKS
jgi:hypothetical protein